MTDDKQNKKKHKSHKKLIIAIVAVVVLAGVAAAAFFGTKALVRNATEKSLMSDLQNTLKLEQLKFHVTMNAPQFNDSSSENVTVDGAYKKDAGLTAKATSATLTSGLQSTRDSQWVIDAKGNVYANLAGLDVKVADKGSAFNTAADIQNMQSASQINTNKNKDVWVKLDPKALKYGQAYGLQACTLSAFYTVQSNPKTFVDFMKQLSGSDNFTIKKSSSQANTYTVSADPHQYGTVSKLYAKSQLYKTLVACDQTQYGATDQSVTDILKKTTVDITVNDSDKIITALKIKVASGITFNATIARADNVTVTVPKVTKVPQPSASQTSAQYLQQNTPYLYKNLLNVQKNLHTQAIKD